MFPRARHRFRFGRRGPRRAGEEPRSATTVFSIHTATVGSRRKTRTAARSAAAGFRARRIDFLSAPFYKLPKNIARAARRGEIPRETGAANRAHGSARRREGGLRTVRTLPASWPRDARRRSVSHRRARFYNCRQRSRSGRQGVVHPAVGRELEPRLGSTSVAIPYNRRTHRCGELRAADIGREVVLAGWVNRARDHGGITFVDLRDHTGITQLRFDPASAAGPHDTARTLHNEDVIAATGKVVGRGEWVNPKLPTGEIEVQVSAVDVLSRSDPLPFQVNDDFEAGEDLCLRYRFLHLRRPEMQARLRLRHAIAAAIRAYFHEHGFIDVETPFLTKSTPEGARDYLVPSRVRPGTFYALPQSPQIFKQLLMIAGYDRYAQIVRCFRDEDLRADRQPEFTQLDMEMAFVQREDVMNVVEGCVQRIFKEALGIDIPLPLPRMTEHEAMNRFGIDRPDTRFGLELQDVTELVRGTEFSVFREAIDKGGVVKCIVASGGDLLTRKVTDGLGDEILGIGGAGLPLTKVAQGAGGLEFATGIAKHIQPLAAQLCAQVGAKAGDTIFFMPGALADVCKYLAHLRGRLGSIMKLVPEDKWNLLWVIDFPLLVWDETEKRWFSTHHPFTAPLDEDIPLLDTDPGKVRDKAYDLVLNGTEMAGGSIRIHQQAVQKKIFGLLGIGEQEAKEKFEFLLDALRFGAPPHGGIAFGLDRWAMMLSKSESLREVIAFPKTQRAVCPLTNAPSPVSQAQLDELFLSVKPLPKK
ncbi:MAG: aspartate--tRNA ligase [Planctomycetes bacterium]|nr:aspartate--tRNA ligase [Planctomycetota bacterium]